VSGERSSVRFAKWVLNIAGIYGLAVMAPQYLLEDQINRDYPPAITHPEYFYGFIGLGVAWQVAFLVMARDPARFRMLLIPSILEKISFGFAAIALFAQQRLPTLLLGFALIDLIFAGLFLAAFVKLRLDASASVGQ
jgi:hypothetical protein